ncbi:DUF4229 domain-containing protein [Actinoplanes siamensis]|uniref:DUF4229 domain-containing protein n=1 Tax=Actinoplanes siamensis TaxID=1223317 RepID=A0A919TPA9_9ACTN|nr:DUF4229 domain-containing protein [Actinoplanes siamensis]GIF09577.1 hypothetical protein Asi03nite_71150 [Actinoplanes siamensis]
MSPAVKYTLGRLGLFVVVFAAIYPTPLNILVKAMIAFVASAGFAFFLLRRWRDEMAEHLGSMAERRSAEKARLRSALAGDDEAAEAGDRVAAADARGGGAGRDAEAGDRVAAADARGGGADRDAGDSVDAAGAGGGDAGRAAGAGAAGNDEAAAAGELKDEHRTEAGK